ncbi:MAG: efflux transporter outer membrane subunit, partial [Burkholderiales bacterium]|nr:efflux transporter outer membrane subunit [Burkholderiales bacterium]
AQWPTLSVSASRTKSNAAAESTGTTIQAQAAWEIDLWGRLAQAVRVAGSNLQASQDDLAAARLSAQATLVQTYFSLRMAEAQQALLERSRSSYARALELTEVRRSAGVASLADVLQAQTQLETVQAQASEQAAQRAQFEHAIAVLLGETPAALAIESTAKLPALPEVPPLLPSTLLERRPDIASAERRVAAAYAQIGVADAAYFPQVSLTAGAGIAGGSLAALVSAPTAAWSIGASVAQAILDNGQRRLASDQARAAADQASAGFRQTVLAAFQEVEDNLVLVDRLGSELEMQRRALAAAQRNLEIVLEQYRAGTVSFLNVSSAQSAALSAEANVISVQGRRLTAAGVLLKNIGGRWQAS